MKRALIQKVRACLGPITGSHLSEHALVALAAGALLIAGSVGAQSTGLTPRAARWLAPGTDAERALNTEPTECLTLPTEPQARLSVEVGRAAFRSPLILGGQAARSGLSCEACHRSGRTNPDFVFPGVSGPPGTADVTSSLFSTHRGDGTVNPKPIPNLSGPKANLKISQATPVLESFIHGLVTEEFDGAEPPARVLKGLADYVRALSPQACPKAANQGATPARRVDDARRALVAGLALTDDGDRVSAIAMLSAARGELFLADERLAGRNQVAERARLRRADAEIAQITQALRRNSPQSRPDLARLVSDLSRQASDGRLPRKPS